MFKIETNKRVTQRAGTRIKIITPAVTEVIQVPEKSKMETVYRHNNSRVTITAKAINIDGYRISKEMVEALLSGEFAGVKGVTTEYNTKKIVNTPLEFDGFVIPAGAIYKPSTYYRNQSFEVGKRSFLISGIPKSANLKAHLREEKTPTGSVIKGYKVTSTKTGVKVGCITASFTDMKAILKVMKSKEKK